MIFMLLSSNWQSSVKVFRLVIFHLLKIFAEILLWLRFTAAYLVKNERPVFVSDRKLLFYYNPFLSQFIQVFSNRMPASDSAFGRKPLLHRAGSYRKGIAR